MTPAAAGAFAGTGRAGARRAGDDPHARAVRAGSRCPVRPPRYAVDRQRRHRCSSTAGADPDWGARSRRRLGGAAPLAEIWEHAGHACRPEWTVKLRNARRHVLLRRAARSRVPAGFVAETAAWAESPRLAGVVAGPQALLGAARAHQERGRGRGGPPRRRRPVLAAGDSLLDADLLEDADRGIVARHGELVASGWRAPHVEVTDGAGDRRRRGNRRWLARRRPTLIRRRAGSCRVGTDGALSPRVRISGSVGVG